MVVSLDNIQKGSLIHHFITSGKRGRCSLCSKMVEKLEAHHVLYSPEKTIKLCHSCHHKVHFWPQRLSEDEILKLLSKRFPPLQAIEIINKKMLGPAALKNLIAPSKSAFISSHSRKVIKVNKELGISSVKRVIPGRVR